MLRLERFMEIQKLHADGLSVSEIARQLHLDRKTVRKYLREAPREYERKPKSWKGGWSPDPGEEGGAAVANGGAGTCLRPLRDDAGRTGADGLGPFRQLGWTAPVCICADAVLVAGAVRGVHAAAGCGDPVELHVHAFRYFGGVTATILTDNMNTVVVDRVEGQPRFHPKMLDFASYYGFVPRVCHPYRPQTKGKIEIDDPLCEVELLAAAGFRYAGGAERTGPCLVRGGQPARACDHTGGAAGALCTRRTDTARWPAGL
jgi:hypothetical protein